MKFLDKILDLTILYSFDSYGFRRHQKYFDKEDLTKSVSGKVCIITGANNGLGYYTAEKLASNGGKVFMLCRNKIKGEIAVNKLIAKGYSAFLKVVDLSDPKSIQIFIERFNEEKVDILIHNAGLIPNKKQLNNYGVELAFATHLLGPHLLTKMLIPKLKGSRLIWVTSGGMYLTKFSFAKSMGVHGKYDGVSSYAYTKRGQVILSEIWSKKLKKNDVIVSSMHPGWVDTPGLKKSLPVFSGYLGKRLRSVAEGADTIYWLAASSNRIIKTGELWFDREKRNKYLWFTKERNKERDALWSYCENFKLI